MIGERLEEARKRKGVTIREAAETTKIRGDYLLAMEDNGFDIPLPQIYVRGFLKNYARYLKLDPNKILTDYDAHLLGRSTHPVVNARSSQRTSLGQVELPQETDEEAPPQERVVVTEAPEEADDGPEPEMHFRLDKRDPADSGRPPPTLEPEGTHHAQESWNESKNLYMKIGLVFAGILIVSIILIVLIQLLGQERETPEINPEVAAPPRQEAPAQPAQPAQPAAAESGSLVIRASDNVTLIVEQTADRQRLFSGSLNAGETLSLEKEGPVSIRFTNGSAIVIESNGQQFRPGQDGVGRTTVE